MAITTNDEQLTPPFNLTLIDKEQQSCTELIELKNAVKLRVKRQHVKSQHKLWMIKSSRASSENNYKIYALSALQENLIQWYHGNLNHPGSLRMNVTIGQHFCWPKMIAQITEHVQKCPICQKSKVMAPRKYGLIPVDNRMRNNPWQRCYVDLIGLWNVNVEYPKGKVMWHKINALTCIDAATGYC